MAYLSKKTLLEAYKVLSTLSENPSAQGATQKVSAIRYALALDMFYKKNNRECDTRDGKDKNEFSNNVCFIVALSDILYTANFYTSVPVHQGDCAVGSNFYSVNAVKNSLTNPTITINYPQRGNNPLFNIQGGKLYQIESYKKNIDFYVSGNSHKFALILWILRNEQLDFSSLYGSIKLQLQRFFTPTMISNLLPTEDNFSEFCKQVNVEGQQDKAIISSNDILALFNESNVIKKTQTTSAGLFDMSTSDKYYNILTALRTKPFLLLAGISGTGKSRIVRELAFKSCPEFLRDADGTTPGNYCMIEVKPNWHDSSELLGYYSHISKEYQYTNFIKFLVKAMMFPDVPFFVCLDEMNLAPVEQYFAEFLSVLETRKKVGDRIHTGALVKPEYFKELQNAEGGDGYIFTQWFPEIKRNIPYNIYTNPTLAHVGLTLPDNVFIIGTVNMDDTTHQFSRKVLDRAMTIEMNGGKLSDMFGQSHNLEYLPEEDIWDVNKFIPEYVTADEVIAVNPDTAEELKTKLPERLEEINEVLKDTPFVVSYRVLNELVIYTGNLLNDGKSIDEAIDEAVNQIVLMKILPRIEGDEDMFIVKGAAENRLEQLAHLVSGATKAKLEEMNNRLSTGFTRFWP